MGEDISRGYTQQGVNIQNVLRIFTTQHQKTPNNPVKNE